jgi:ABC-type multidrug transport system ATPase subunit
MTHDMSEIIKLYDRIGILQNGVLKFKGTRAFVKMAFIAAIITYSHGGCG